MKIQISREGIFESPAGALRPCSASFASASPLRRVFAPSREICIFVSGENVKMRECPLPWEQNGYDQDYGSIVLLLVYFLSLSKRKAENISRLSLIRVPVSCRLGYPLATEHPKHGANTAKKHGGGGGFRDGSDRTIESEVIYAKSRGARSRSISPSI